MKWGMTMSKKNKMILLISLCVMVAVLLLCAIWIFVPSEGKVIFHVQETGITVEDALSYREMVTVKWILCGKIRWPEWIYGYPACGFGTICAIVLDDTYYMPAWDSCGMLGVMDSTSDEGKCTYINITDRQKDILNQIIKSRGDMQ